MTEDCFCEDYEPHEFYHLDTDTALDWVICGGESGPNARSMHSDWVRSIRDQCEEAGVALFVKQMGGSRDKRGELFDLPDDLRIREVPHANS